MQKNGFVIKNCVKTYLKSYYKVGKNKVSIFF